MLALDTLWKHGPNQRNQKVRSCVDSRHGDAAALELALLLLLPLHLLPLPRGEVHQEVFEPAVSMLSLLGDGSMTSTENRKNRLDFPHVLLGD